MPNAAIKRQDRILSLKLQKKLYRTSSYIQYAITGAFLAFSIFTIINIFTDVPDFILSIKTEYICTILGAVIGGLGGRIISERYEPGFR